ncbi:MAG: glycosyltransferase [Lachnospiraceae bacterium]|nr:glycosyltransferase [Lachnospiraceae bacterium]
MKIILCTWGSLCESGIISAAERLGYNLITFTQSYTDVDYDKNYFTSLVSFISANTDASCVFSINYIPIISRACKPFKIPYISLNADCPCSTLYSKTLEYPHNRVFLFDRLQAEKFMPVNPENIHHIPLATDVEYWHSISLSKDDISIFNCDVSFVGSLYTEKCQYNRIENKLPQIMKGYVDGLIIAQQNVYGYYFIEDSITEEWAREFQKYAELSLPAEDYEDDIRAIIADNYLGYKCTEQERINTLRAISNYFNIDLWTASDASMLPNVNVRGVADSSTMMPKIFKCSKININITNRAIRSGIPLRVLDIMGCGGFIISNYQPELTEYFVPDKEIVLYDSIPDLLSKIDHYLKHDNERIQIAQNGYEKVKKLHTYDNRLAQILEIAQLT